MNDVRTVGDLRKLIAKLDADGISDDIPLARSGTFGAEWCRGWDQCGLIQLVTFGDDLDKMTFALDDTKEARFPLRNWNGTRSEPFTALAFD